jgi:hypothetical protein
MSEKLTGYILLGIGAVVMIIALIQILSIMSSSNVPVVIFKISETTSSGSNGSFNPLDPSSLLDSLNSGDLSSLNLIDPKVISNLLNIIVYYLIMQFLMGFGYKIASLGVQLLRPINVNMKNRDLTTEETPKEVLTPRNPEDEFN